MVVKRDFPDYTGASTAPKRSRAGEGVPGQVVAAADDQSTQTLEESQSSAFVGSENDTQHSGSAVNTQAYDSESLHLRKPDDSTQVSLALANGKLPAKHETHAPYEYSLGTRKTEHHERTGSSGSDISNASRASSAVSGLSAVSAAVSNGANEAAPDPETKLTPPVEYANVDVDSVICNLALPDKNIQVATEYSNTRSTDTQVQAYAKLAGRSWTFYVQRLEVVIGRRAVDSRDHVDIDLGPSKVISRRHAAVAYNLNTRCWELAILGRNGVKVDGTSQKSGVLALRSGHVLEIGGVQMMFVLPDAHPAIAPNMVPPGLTLLSPSIVHRVITGTVPSGYAYPSTQSRSSGPGPVPNRGQGFDTAFSKTSSSYTPPTNDAPLQAQRIPSRPYPNGVAMVSAPQVRGLNVVGSQFGQDLSSDDCKDIKPPFSYATMISQAILSSKENSMSLSDIYAWISATYSFYRHAKPGWQNSIRHNLSLNKAFEKVARKENEPGKGCKWQIMPKYKEEFLRKAQSGKLVKGRGHNSPAAVNMYVPPQQTSNSGGMTAVPARHFSQQEFTSVIPDHRGSILDSGPSVIMRGNSHSQGQSHVFEASRIGAVSMAQPRDSQPSRHAADAHDDGLDRPGSPSRLQDIPTLPSSIVRKLPDIELDRPYLDFLEGEYNATSPSRYMIAQSEAYTPDRGSSSSKKLVGGPTPKLSMNVLAGSSPAFWKYMQFGSTPVKPNDKSPSRIREEVGELGGVDLRF